MTISLRTPIASIAQFAVAGLAGTPLAGWILARHAATRLERPRTSVASMLWIACSWLAVAFVLARLAGFPEPDRAASVPSWVRSVGIAAHVATVGLQTRWFANWLGREARRHPPLDWQIVVRVILLVSLLSMVAVFGALILLTRLFP